MNRVLHREVLTCVVLVAGLTAHVPVAAKTLNGFDVSNASVPVGRIVQGGPPRDGIPAIHNPRFASAANVPWLADDAQVLGLEIDGDARAYPIAILNWHELVNDVVAGRPILVSFCPLCGTGMAFDAQVDGARLTFGVSGLLYNSDVLFYDQSSESLWSQIKRVAISGPKLGRELVQVPMRHTTWGDWRARHPGSKVLSRELGFARNYEDDPYEGYAETRQLFFKVAGRTRHEYHPKERVMGVVRGGRAIAFPFQELRKQGRERFVVDFAGERLEVRWQAEHDSASIRTADGAVGVSTQAFWFAWVAFHPDTEVFRAP